MQFLRQLPCVGLSPFVECYWQVEGNNTEPTASKIIPDGFSEIIIHFGDPYLIRFDRSWSRQKLYLFGGQLRHYFFLKNTGRSGIFGIKFKPCAPAELFGLHMNKFTDKVVALERAIPDFPVDLCHAVGTAKVFQDRIAVVEKFLLSLLQSAVRHLPMENVIEILLAKGGHLTVKQIAQEMNLTERQVERLFTMYIGLPPKFYSRVIRFSRIFTLIEQKDPRWLDLMYEAGFYDQSHLIRNFKAFTGEDPSKYNFTTMNMANFFLLKKKSTSGLYNTEA